MEIDLTGLQKPDLFARFRIQVQRDFELAGLSDQLPVIESNNLAALKQAFLDAILKLEIGNALKTLLYRIDITELQIKQASLKNQDMNLQQVLAELMIKRILQKVILKELYSK
jgi:hypothetical protein